MVRRTMALLKSDFKVDKAIFLRIEGGTSA